MSEGYPSALESGANVEGYEIKCVLGQGGFGITYLAHDHTLDGKVALKEYFPSEHAVRRRRRVLPNSRASESVFEWGLEQFRQEAKVIHKFRHQNVVHVKRIFEDSGTAYIAMEYVDGPSLDKTLREREHGTLSAAEWWPMLERLLDGLEHIHNKDFLHRDIKPGNLVVRTADDNPVFIDFGCARIATGERTQAPAWTPAYAAPEMYGSFPKAAPTDLYSLGAVSYRVLSGELPPEALDRYQGRELVPLADRVTDANPDWLAAIETALRLGQGTRPQTVAAWRKALRAAWGSGPSPVPQPYEDWYW